MEITFNRHHETLVFDLVVCKGRKERLLHVGRRPQVELAVARRTGERGEDKDYLQLIGYRVRQGGASVRRACLYMARGM